MKEYRKILVLVDGSDLAEKAFLEASQIAKRNQAQLLLLTVIDVTSFRGTASVNSIEITKELQKKAQQMITKLKEKVDFPLETQIAAGNPKLEIIKAAEDFDSDLIVMGATGLNRLGQWMLGSTTGYVVNHSSCNVMVIK
ncbi:universal stress protein [Enterococcus sp. AZ072]|uniref:universal stress protein n=1 Tax=unclassified Enterococcus TaxID=2608891 RepID=UPI003D2840EE